MDQQNFIRVTQENEFLWGMDPNDFSLSTRFAICLAMLKESRRTMKDIIIPSCAHEQCVERRTGAWTAEEQKMVTLFLAYIKQPSPSNMEALENRAYLLSDFMKDAMRIEIMFQVREELKEARKEFGSVKDIVKNVLARLMVPEEGIKITLVAIPKNIRDAVPDVREVSDALLTRIAKDASSQKWKS